MRDGARQEVLARSITPSGELIIGNSLPRVTIYKHVNREEQIVSTLALPFLGGGLMNKMSLGVAGGRVMIPDE